MDPSHSHGSLDPEPANTPLPSPDEEASGPPGGPEAGSPPRPSSGAGPAWSPAKRFGFRLLAVYFVLYTLPFPVGFVPGLGSVAETAVHQGWDAAAQWVARHGLGLEDELFTGPTGSGDTTVDYVRLLMTAVLALAGALAWTLADRRRRRYEIAPRWLETGCRYYLALTLLSYGLFKVIPVQFSPPSLTRLLTPYGDSSPMGILWTFMGASMAYTVFAGLGEVVGAVLLLFRRTRLLGALVSAGVLTNVVVLNFAYDVPVKLFSSHLLAMAVALIALDGRRLVAFFVRNTPAPAANHPPLFGKRWANVAARTVGVALVATMVWSTASRAWSTYANRRDGWASPLRGVHDVETFRADGAELAALTTDELRWRALVIDSVYPADEEGGTQRALVAVQHMDGSLDRHLVILDEAARTITWLPEGQPSLEAAEEAGVEVTDVLAYERPEPDRLVLRGPWQGRTIEVHLRGRDLSTMELTGRGFQWINERPYNR
ncbi:MAG: hypothetical protein ACOC7L_00315 [Acidobacteriota bacterium]